MFYERVNELCKQGNTTISVFTREVLGLNSSSATGWKKGSSPNSDVVAKVARYFGVTSDYLLGLDALQSDSADGLMLSDTERFIIDELRKATPEARSAAIAAMRSVLASLSKSGAAAEYYNSDHENSTENKGAV